MKALRTVNLQSVCGCEHDFSKAPVTGWDVPASRLGCFRLMIHEPQFAPGDGCASQQDASATFGWLWALRVEP